MHEIYSYYYTTTMTYCRRKLEQKKESEMKRANGSNQLDICPFILSNVNYNVVSWWPELYIV